MGRAEDLRNYIEKSSFDYQEVEERTGLSKEKIQDSSQTAELVIDCLSKSSPEEVAESFEEVFHPEEDQIHIEGANN